MRCEHLGACLLADDLLEVAHHRGERMRAGHGSEDVVGVLDVGDPVAHGLVDRVLEGARSGRHRDDLGAEQAHARHVEGLALGVDLAHVDDAVEAEQGGGRRRGDAVLAGAGLGDDAGLADAAGEQGLPEHVVDLVRARVVQVFALEDDAGAAGVLGEARHLGDERRTADVVHEQVGQLGRELGVELGELVGLGEFVERRDERLGDEASAEIAEVRAFFSTEGHRVHTCRKSWSVDSGSPWVTRASPTRTTSAPAAR